MHTESWPYGKGWTLEKFTLEMTEPRYFPMIGYPEAWSPSTAGEIVATPVYIGDLANGDSVKARAQNVRGAIVLATRPQDTFITADRQQPTEHDQPVPIGAPRSNVAAGPLAVPSVVVFASELKSSGGHRAKAWGMGRPRAGAKKNEARAGAERESANRQAHVQGQFAAKQ